MSKIADKTFSILSAFTADYPRLDIDQLAIKTQIPPSSLYRYLKVLVENGYLAKISEGSFRLGNTILKLGRIAEYGCEFRELAIPRMESLREQLAGETVTLWTRLGYEKLCVESREPRGGGIKYSASPGETQPLHAGAAGKVLLSFLSTKEQLLILNRITLTKFTDRTITEIPLLLQDLSKIRVQGYACSEGEYIPMSYSVAAPIRNGRGIVEASLAVNGVISKRKNPIDKIIKLVTSAVNEIYQERI